jgi:hypothetical protein
MAFPRLFWNSEFPDLTNRHRHAKYLGYLLLGPLSLRLAGGGRFEQLTLPSGQSRAPSSGHMWTRSEPQPLLAGVPMRSETFGHLYIAQVRRRRALAFDHRAYMQALPLPPVTQKPSQ